MRNLTLGLLIVAGGTLAALPFRQNVPIDESIRATEPLDPTSVSTPSFSSPVGMLVDDAEPQSEWMDRLVPESRGQVPAWPPQREFSAPLTYDELAMPISRPDKIEQRFTAIEKTTPQKQTRIDSASVSSQPMRLSANTQPVPAAPGVKGSQSILVSESRQETKLASAPLSESKIERLPKRNESTRERFWIRQP